MYLLEKEYLFPFCQVTTLNTGKPNVKYKYSSVFYMSSSVFLFVDEEESKNKVNIDDLYETKHRKDLKQLSIFNKILARIHKRIQFTGRTKTNDRHIWFNVPEYIFGEPIYNKGDCIAYLVVKLEDNGFLVKYIHPNTLFVSWAQWVPGFVRNEFKKKTGKIVDEKGNITTPVRKGDNLLPEDDINNGLFSTGPQLIQQQKDKEKAQFKPISKYKPTGNLVYNPDILEKIEKKVSFTPTT